MDGANLLTHEDLPRMRAVFAEAFDLLGPDVVSVHAKDFPASLLQKHPSVRFTVTDEVAQVHRLVPE